MSRAGLALSLAAAAAAAGVAAFAAARKARRDAQDALLIPLRCHCGKVKGRISCLPEDACALQCYCDSCCRYARWCAEEAGKHADGKGCPSVLVDDKVSKLVHVCKSDVAILEGMEHVKLAAVKEGTLTKRFYADCCHTPLLNTGKALGMMGVFLDALDLSALPPSPFGESYLAFPDECSEDVSGEGPPMGLGMLLWNVARYAPSRNQGPPLDYDQTPTSLVGFK